MHLVSTWRVSVYTHQRYNPSPKIVLFNERGLRIEVAHLHFLRNGSKKYPKCLPFLDWTVELTDLQGIFLWKKDYLLVAMLRAKQTQKTETWCMYYRKVDYDLSIDRKTVIANYTTSPSFNSNWIPHGKFEIQTFGDFTKNSTFFLSVSAITTIFFLKYGPFFS